MIGMLPLTDYNLVNFVFGFRPRLQVLPRPVEVAAGIRDLQLSINVPSTVRKRNVPYIDGSRPPCPSEIV